MSTKFDPFSDEKFRCISSISCHVGDGVKNEREKLLRDENETESAVKGSIFCDKIREGIPRGITLFCDLVGTETSNDQNEFNPLRKVDALVGCFGKFFIIKIVW
jgi:hypothetical protein